MALKTTIACQRIMTKSCLASESTIGGFWQGQTCNSRKKERMAMALEKDQRLCYTWIARLGYYTAMYYLMSD